MNKVILCIGASGQIGSELVLKLEELYPKAEILTPSIEDLDVCFERQVTPYFKEHQPTHVYHLAGILSAKSENDIKTAWYINTEGLFNILNACLEFKAEQVFWPSSIAAYSFSTMYGLTKLTGEHLCGYYKQKGLDVRSLRFPGIISHKTECGGGTTDWAVEMFKSNPYTCFIEKDVTQPMMYMPDALEAITALMEAPVVSSTVYDISSMSFCPGRLQKELGTTVFYEPDFRNEIAKSWPESTSPTQFMTDTGWKWKWGFDDMVGDMIKHTS